MNENINYLSDKISEWKDYIEDKFSKYEDMSEYINAIVGEMQYVLNLMDYWYSSPKRLKTKNKK